MQRPDKENPLWGSGPGFLSRIGDNKTGVNSMRGNSMRVQCGGVRYGG